MRRCWRDGAKRKSVRKSCRSAGDPAWKTMQQHREDAAGWGAVTELLLAGAPMGIAVGTPAEAERHREAAAGITGSKKQHREESTMAKMPGSDANVGKECTFAA